MKHSWPLNLIPNIIYITFKIIYNFIKCFIFIWQNNQICIIIEIILIYSKPFFYFKIFINYGVKNYNYFYACKILGLSNFLLISSNINNENINHNINAVDVLNKLPWGLNGKRKVMNKQFIIEALKFFLLQLFLIDLSK